MMVIYVYMHVNFTYCSERQQQRAVSGRCTMISVCERLSHDLKAVERNTCTGR